MKIKKLAMDFRFPLVISNHFYLSAIVNYKLVFIGGVVFLWNRLKIRALIFILIFLVSQTISILLYSEQSQGDLVLLFSTILMVIGLYGWVSEGLRRNMLKVSPKVLLILSVISLIAPNSDSYLGLDPLVLFLFYHICSTYQGNTPVYRSFIIYIVFSIIMGWRAAIVGLLGGMYFWAVKKTKPITQAGFVVLGVVFVWLLYEYLLSDIYSVLLATGTGGDPTSGRLAMYVTAFHIFIEGIRNFEWGAFFGYGFNSPASLFDETLRVTITIFDIEIVSEKQTFGKDRLHMHNFFLQTLFEFGLFGLGTYFYMLWRFFTHSKTFALFTVVGLLSGLLSGTFYFYSVYYVVLFGLYVHENNSKFLRLPT